MQSILLHSKFLLLKQDYSGPTYFKHSNIKFVKTFHHKANIRIDMTKERFNAFVTIKIVSTRSQNI